MIVKSSSGPGLRLLGKAGLLALVFAAGAGLAIELSRHTGNVAALWPSNAVALAVLLLGRRRDWPAYAIGAGLGNLAVGIVQGDGLALSAGFALCNLSEILLAFGLLQYFAVSAQMLASLRSLLLFLAAILLASGVAATLGAQMISGAFGASFWPVWRSWWVSDAVALAIITPALLAWGERPWRLRAPSVQAIEAAVLASSLVAATITAFVLQPANHALGHALLLLPLPLQMWAALRFGARGATAANLFVAIAGVGALLGGISPFTGYDDAAAGVSGLQAFIAAHTLSTLLLAAVLNERRQAEARLGDAIEGMRDCVVLFDADDRLVLCNGRYREVYAEVADLMVPGVTFERLLREVARLGMVAEAAGREEEWVARRLREYRDPRDEVEHRLHNGRWVLVRNRQTSDGGVVGVHTDITRLKEQEKSLRQSERRLRHLVESTAVIPFTWDVEAERFTYVGPQATAIVGYPPETWTDLENWLSRIHPEDREWVRAQQKHSTTFEYRMIARDGRIVWVHDTLNIEPDEDGRPVGHGLVFDITEAKLREAALRQAQKMEAVGQLTGGIAHDFNNLLGVIIGNLELAAGKAAGNPDFRRELADAMAAAELGTELTSRLLAFARRQPLQPETLDLNDLVLGVGGLLRRTLGDDVGIEIETGTELWPINIDRSALQNALLNLALNARDAMPNGGRLTIETLNSYLEVDYSDRHVDVLPGEYVQLAVSDTGVGMTPEIVERAFEPFFTTKEAGDGSGLGLSMVYGFAKQSGGHVKIYSEVGRGTSVVVYLPRAEAARVPTPVPATKDGNDRGGETILVVEDNPALREVAVSGLARLGYWVLAAGDAAAALRIIAGGEPIDLLFTDVVMPNGMNGRELAEACLTQRPGLKVLFTSGYAQDTLVRGGKLEADVRLLPKPYKLGSLARKVREALDGPQPGPATAQAA